MIKICFLPHLPHLRRLYNEIVDPMMRICQMKAKYESYLSKMTISRGEKFKIYLFFRRLERAILLGNCQIFSMEKFEDRPMSPDY